MKVKMNLYISDPEQFAKSPTSSCYSLISGRYMDKDWTFAGEIEFDINLDDGVIIQKAKAELDERIGKHTAAINVLETRKAELLALPAPHHTDTWTAAEPYPDEPGFSQQDRPLSSGKVKTATGYVVEPTTEDISEYAGDLPRNF